MTNDKPSFLIKGSGWYGCHAATVLLENNFKFNMVDKTNDIFTGSSSKNQNRLHIGFHYPRSEKTREECISGYERFIKRYSNVVTTIKDNIYCVAKDSCIDYATYCKIFNDNKYFGIINNLKNINNKFGLNVDLIDGALNTQEKLINPEKSKKYFSNLLSDKLIKTDSVLDINKLEKNYDYVLDCTFGQSNNFNNFKYELSICLVYSTKIKTSALTIMDGPFFSIFPLGSKEGLYTLTHVKHTPVFSSNNINNINKLKNGFRQKHLEKIIRNIEKDVKTFIPNFEEIYEYKTYYLSIKTKSTEKNDNRSLFWHQDGKNLHFVGGKITGIFSMEEVIKEQILKKL